MSPKIGRRKASSCRYRSPKHHAPSPTRDGPCECASARQERSVAEEYAKRLRIRARSVRQPASDLSGGNQQKVVISKWLATKPRGPDS